MMHQDINILWKHYGFDFVVHVEDTNFNIDGRKRTNPKHDDIIEDLEKNIMKIN